MRVLIISDIHANLAAFEAVLAEAQNQWDIIWCLGDLVGYGPDPNECVALLQTHPHISLSGNHDWAVLGKLDIQNFNREAQIAIRWTREAINTDTHDYLDALPPVRLEDRFTLAHASPRQPVWEYILDSYTAAINFEHFETPYCLVGHTHVPIVFEETDPNHVAFHRPDYTTERLLADNRLIINPGSVGQPRDSDPRAAYALLDTDTNIWQFKRVDYPITITQDKMRQYGIPSRLIKRLEFGL
ncbi:MAG: metallophosphoesterase family protein [Candidatus Promineifilaceae bacterium]|nr:metallophosphoesterase family protein [Chloroflexota bacterium]